MGCACGKPNKTQPAVKIEPSKGKVSLTRPKLTVGEAIEMRSSSKIFSDQQQKLTPEIVIVPSKVNKLKQQSAGYRTPVDKALSISEQPPAIYAEALKQLKSPPGEPEELRSALRRSPSNRRSVASKTQTFAGEDVFKQGAKNPNEIDTRKIYHLKSSAELFHQRETLAKTRKSVAAVSGAEKLEKAFVAPSQVEGPKLTLRGRPILLSTHSGNVVEPKVALEPQNSLGRLSPLTPLKLPAEVQLPKDKTKNSGHDPEKQQRHSESRSGKQLPLKLVREPLSALPRDRAELSSKRLSLSIRGF